MQKRVEEVRSVLVKITESEAEADQRLAEIEVSASVSNTENKTVWQELLRPSPALSRMMIIGLGIQCFQQITDVPPQADVPDHSEMANGAGSDNWISLSLGAGGHVDHASTNELKSKQLFTTQETDTVGCPIMVVLIYTSLLLSMNGPRSNKSTPNGRRSEGPFSHPRQPRSVRPRLYLSIESDSD